MITIKLVDGSKKWSIPRDRGRIRELLNNIGLLSEEYIIIRNSKVVTPEDEAVDGDEIILYPVVSGG